LKKGKLFYIVIAALLLAACHYAYYFYYVVLEVVDKYEDSFVLEFENKQNNDYIAVIYPIYTYNVDGYNNYKGETVLKIGPDSHSYQYYINKKRNQSALVFISHELDYKYINIVVDIYKINEMNSQVYNIREVYKKYVLHNPEYISEMKIYAKVQIE